jgi:hypothetical protein
VTEPVRVVLNKDNSHAVRFLFQKLQPEPSSMTTLVNAAVRHFVEQMAEREDNYHAPFRELTLIQRRRLRVLP